MKALWKAALGCLCLVAGLTPVEARAADELQLWRLGNPAVDATANDRFRLLMVDLGMATAPTPLHPAESLGRVGFSLDVGLRWADVHGDARVGGGCPESNPDCSVWVTTDEAPGGLLMPFLHVRKGLPLSFELDGKLQYVSGADLWAATAGLRWALNEGLDYLPDISVGTQVTRAVGHRDFGLTTGTLDVLVGKWFSIAGTYQITPYLGWQRVWISAVSDVVDFDPANEDMAEPVADDDVFEEVRIGDGGYDRFVLGGRFLVDLMQLGLELAYEPGYLDQSDAFVVAFKVGVDL